MSVGGIGEAKEANDQVHEICRQVRDEVETKSGRKFAEYQPLTFKQQLVNGVNYFIKVKVDNDEHLHIRAHRSFDGKVTYSSHQEKKGKEDKISYF